MLAEIVIQRQAGIFLFHEFIVIQGFIPRNYKPLLIVL
jgi:hypothetical protein